jgi:hypothetical protein
MRVMEHARLTGNVDRVISVGLSEAEWQAFVASIPQPVSWLRERIREAISASAQVSDAANTTSETIR